MSKQAGDAGTQAAAAAVAAACCYRDDDGVGGDGDVRLSGDTDVSTGEAMEILECFSRWGGKCVTRGCIKDLWGGRIKGEKI